MPNHGPSVVGIDVEHRSTILSELRHWTHLIKRYIIEKNDDGSDGYFQRNMDTNTYAELKNWARRCRADVSGDKISFYQRYRLSWFLADSYATPDQYDEDFILCVLVKDWSHVRVIVNQHKPFVIDPQYNHNTGDVTLHIHFDYGYFESFSDEDLLVESLG